MKKVVSFLVISLFVFNLSAQTQCFYAGVNGSFVFSGGGKTGSGLGGGFLFESGACFGLFDLGLQGGYSKTEGEGLIVSMTELKLGAAGAINLNSDVLKFLPEFICIKPEIVYFAELYGTQHYRNESLKQRGFLEKSRGFTSQLTADVSVMFPNILKAGSFNLVPYVGYAFNMKFDKSGIIPANNAFLGVRLNIGGKSAGGEEKSPLNVMCSFTNTAFTPDGNGVNDEAIFQTGEQDSKVDSWELDIFDADKNLFYSKKGKRTLPQQIVWDGTGNSGEKVLSGSTYQFVLMVEDDGAKGLVPGVLNVDVFVVEKDGKLNITLPSISFSPDSADFAGLSEVEMIRNNQLLEQVAAILQEYGDYQAEISGHAHNVSGTTEENENELIPLSRARAQKVLDELVKRGIDKNRLSCVGKGSDEPLAQNENEIWKNRRVEILLKK